jgi:murein DD-endopeptidase MepM/ murein hydrolase activator NlpD
MKSPSFVDMHLCGVLAIVAAALFAQSPAKAHCADDWLSIKEVQTGDGVELHAINYQNYPITYALMIDQDERDGPATHTISETLPGLQSQRVLVLPRQKDSVDISCTWTIGSRYATHDDDHVYRLPYAEGNSFRVLQGFESDWSHRGDEQFAIDFKLPVGTPVHAARSGIVARKEERWDHGCWDQACDRFANFIVVLHDDGTTGEYYHLQQDGALVEVGERVAAGQQIGLSGDTGRSAEPHLHFAVYHATRSGHSQSIPISFLTAGGIVYEPRNGHYYSAVSRQDTGD